VKRFSLKEMLDFCLIVTVGVVGILIWIELIKMANLFEKLLK
jgi:hypothetical protein